MSPCKSPIMRVRCNPFAANRSMKPIWVRRQRCAIAALDPLRLDARCARLLWRLAARRRRRLDRGPGDLAVGRERDRHRQSAIGEQNKAAGEKYLADNKKNKDVTELASGLQYKVLTKGAGAQPKATDTVTVHYRGTLIDGTEFDSSYSRGEPVAISLQEVIPGWQEAVPLMPVGSKWQIFVPAKLGYGEGAAGPIGPHSTLIFDIELLSIN